MTQQQLYTVPPRQPRATKDSRVNTMGSLWDSYGQADPAVPLAPGHDQQLFDPQYSLASIRQGGWVVPPPARNNRGQHNQNLNQHNNIAGLKLLLVGRNECYARAALQFLVPLEVIAQLIVCPSLTDWLLF